MSRLSFLVVTLFLGVTYLVALPTPDKSKIEICKVYTFSYDSSDSLLAESIARGKNVYLANCLSCHMTSGEGIPGAFPPLAKSDYLMADSVRAIRVAMYGQSDEITVNGVKYHSPSPSLNHLSDQQIADVMNYVRNSWGNKGAMITTELVTAQRKEE